MRFGLFVSNYKSFIYFDWKRDLLLAFKQAYGEDNEEVNVGFSIQYSALFYPDGIAKT